jgi:uncharacterized protein involved in response to NO
MSQPWEPGLVHLGLLGFLVPIALAISARTFPLYLRVQVPKAPALYGVLAALVVGLVLRLGALFAPPPCVGCSLGAAGLLDAFGRLLEGAALLGAAWVLDAPLLRTRAATLAATAARVRQLGATPRPLPPRARELIAADRLLRSAYAWLVVAAILQLISGGALLTGGTPPPVDAERHAIGAGFITLLIFGMGVHLLPGFLGRRMASARLAWATLWLGSGAVHLRVLPVLLTWLVGLGGDVTIGAAQPLLALVRPLLSLAGLLGMGAVGCFGWNLWRTLR